MKLSAARCGNVHVDGGLLDTGELTGSLRVVPSMCFVVEHPAGTLVWDTSMNPAVCDDAVGYWGPLATNVTVPEYDRSSTVLARLALLGIDPTSVRYVVNSHLHNDHCGMNRFFPDATVLVREREYQHAVASAGPYAGYVADDFMGDGQKLELFDYDDRFDVFDDGSVELQSTIGHTAGHQSLAITFASGRRFLLTGDAVYNGAQLDAASPPGVTFDRDEATESARKLRGFRDRGATVLVHHDVETWATVADVAELWRED